MFKVEIYKLPYIPENGNILEYKAIGSLDQVKEAARVKAWQNCKEHENVAASISDDKGYQRALIQI